MNNDGIRKNGSIEGLQYLRGIAALMVVFFHAESYFGPVPAWSQLGARGVDIFFVISGFIIAYATRHMAADTPAVRASLEFLSKRLIRVVPLYWIALLWTSRDYWLGWLASSRSLSQLFANRPQDLGALLKDFVFVPHLSIDEDEEGEIFPVLIQGWTLNFEMFFYLLFACALLVGKYRLMASSAVLVTLVVIGQLNEFTTVMPLFYTSSSLVEFVFGILVFELYIRRPDLTVNPRLLALLGILGVALLNSGSMVNSKFIMGAAAAIIVWVSIYAFAGTKFSVLKVLGDASYSIYLFHAAVFVEVRDVLHGAQLNANEYVNAILVIGGQMLIAIAAGIAIYYVIEKPLLRMLRRKIQNGRVPAASEAHTLGQPS
jgi:exopolysaccharide production protein ExoZ